MYLRPGSLFLQFIVERKCMKMDDSGRTKIVFQPTWAAIQGVLSNAKTSELVHWKAMSHPITHTILQHYGEAMAKPGDRLMYNGRYFYVQGVDNASNLGIFIIYYVEERSDFIG